MTRTSYQLMKNYEPIAIGSMSHCLDVFYWEIYYGYNHLEYNIVSFRQDEEVYRKAKAFDEIEQAYWKSNTPENFAYDFVGIFEKHFSNGVECADDER